MNPIVLLSLVSGLLLLIIALRVANKFKTKHVDKFTDGDPNINTSRQSNILSISDKNDKYPISNKIELQRSGDGDLFNNNVISDDEAIKMDNQSSKMDNENDEIKAANDFVHAQACIQGLSHKKADPPIPCQDAFRTGILPNGFVVIITSDGAGSSACSDIASNYCVNTLYECIQRLDWTAFLSKPTNKNETHAEWDKVAKSLFETVRNSLLILSTNEGILCTDLNCTLLLVIKTNWGFLSANIGDGRAGFSDGKAQSLVVPLMAFTAGATFFLIKDGWENAYRSYVTIVEKPDNIKYFFASTDGCQDFIMDRSSKGPREGIYDALLGDEAYYDLNLPYEPFFDGLIASLREAASHEERNLRLQRLVEEGIYVLNGEEKELKSISDPILDDDKTLVLYYI